MIGSLRVKGGGGGLWVGGLLVGGGGGGMITNFLLVLHTPREQFLSELIFNFNWFIADTWGRPNIRIVMISM